MEIETLKTYFRELARIKPTGNAIYSPVSTRIALNMYKYMENTKQYNDLLNNRPYLDYKNNENITKFVNRIWFNKIYLQKVDKKLKDLVFPMDMSDFQKATNIKDKFVSEQTNGFITKTPTILNENTIYDIMNVTYFKDIWDKHGGYILNPQEMKFHNINGTETEVPNFTASSSRIRENDTCYLVALKYKHKNNCWLIYPKTTIEEINFDNLQIIKAIATMVIPEFEMNNTYGLENIFNTKANVSLTQTAKIKFDYKGTEAAAVTEMMKCSAMPMIDKTQRIELIFNKPFMYIIEDTINKDYIFIGRIESF